MMFFTTIRQSDATSNRWMLQSSATPNSSLHAIASRNSQESESVTIQAYITIGVAAPKWCQPLSRRQSSRLQMLPGERPGPIISSRLRRKEPGGPVRKEMSLPKPQLPTSKRRNKKRPSPNLHVPIHSVRPTPP
jgi:hypothetical protein